MKMEPVLLVESEARLVIKQLVDELIEKVTEVPGETSTSNNAGHVPCEFIDPREEGKTLKIEVESDSIDLKKLGSSFEGGDEEITSAKGALKEMSEVLSEEWTFYKRKKHVFFTRHMYIWLLFLIGAVTSGALSVAFSKLVNQATDLLETWASERHLQPLIFLFGPVGLTMIFAAVYYFFWGASGSGIPLEMALLEEMEDGKNLEAVAPEFMHKELSREDIDIVFGRRVRHVLCFRIAVGKFFLMPLGVAMGASIGREGPTVQICCCVIYGFLRLGFWASKTIRSEILHTDESRFQYFKAACLAGGAAGIAAAFNTPMGGVIFAVEEMGNYYDRAMGRLVLTSVVLSGVVSLGVNGGERYFGFVNASATGEELAIAVPICIFFGSLLGGLWSALLYAILKFKRRVRVLREHPFLVSAFFGLLFAINGYVSGSQVYGSGYGYSRSILTDELTYCTLPANATYKTYDRGHVAYPNYGIAKMASTLFAYATGIPGGIFSPSLSAGAGWGAVLYCTILRKLSPTIKPSIVTILTMQAYFAGVTQSPLTSYAVLMGAVLFSQDDKSVNLEVARLVVSLVSSSLSRVLMPKSLYGSMAEQGIPGIPMACFAPDLQKLKKEEAEEREREKLLKSPSQAKLEMRQSLFREESWY